MSAAVSRKKLQKSAQLSQSSLCRQSPRWSPITPHISLTALLELCIVLEVCFNLETKTAHFCTC